jgi:hypothetical protein
MGAATTYYPGATAPQVDFGASTTASSAGSSAGAYTFVVGQLLQLGSNIYGGILQNSIYKSNSKLYEAQGNYSSSVAEYNAAVSRANAEAIRSVADLEIESQKKQEARFKGAQTAGYAKSGVKLTGSPIEVMIDSATEFKRNQAITDYNAKIGMMQATSQAKIYDVAGQLAKSEAGTKAALSRIEGNYKQGQSAVAGTSNLLTSSIDFYKIGKY